MPDMLHCQTRLFLSASNEYAMDVLGTLLGEFDAKIQCHPPHAKLLKDVSMRVKILQKLREFLESTFGKENEGHEGVDPIQLAKTR